MTISHLKLNVGGRTRSLSTRKMSLPEALEIVRDKHYSAEVERQVVKEVSGRPEGTYVAYLKELPRRVHEIVKKMG